MYAIRTLIPALMIMVLAFGSLPGCSTAGKDVKSSMSLMDRYKAGKSLIGPEEDESEFTPAVHLERGDAYMRRNQPELAFDQYSKAALKDPAYTEARFKKGGILFDNGMYNEAMVEFRAVLEQNPRHAAAREAVGRIYFNNGLYPEAREYLAKVISLDDTLVEAHVLLGATLNYMDDYEAAAAEFMRASELSPNSGYIYNNLGLALVKLDHKEEAVDAFSKALMLGAPADKTCNNLGVTLFKLGREKEALEAFKCAGDEAAAYNNLGYAYFLDERYDEAAMCFEKAIELRPMFYVRADENLKRARLAAEFARHAPAGETAAEPKVKSIPASFQGDSPVIEHTIAEPEESAPEIKKVMKIYPESPAKLTVKNPDRPVFSVHASSWRTNEKAENQAEFLNGLGLDARVMKVEIEGKGVWHRVVVGSYNEYDKAVDALQAAAKITGLEDMRIIRCTLPESCDRKNM